MTATTSDPTDPATFVDGPPHPWFARLRREAPLWWHESRNGPSFWLVTRYDDVADVLGRPTAFVNRHGITIEPDEPAGLPLGAEERGQGALSYTDPPRHRLVRRVLAPHFTPARVRALEPVVRAHAEALVGTFAANGGGDFVAERFGGILVQLALADRGTTRAAAANGTRILAEQPEVRAGLIAEPSLVPGAVEEVLRYRSPVHYTRRTVPLDDTGEPAVIAGRTLDPGSIVYLRDARLRHQRAAGALLLGALRPPGPPPAAHRV